MIFDKRLLMGVAVAGMVFTASQQACAQMNTEGTSTPQKTTSADTQFSETQIQAYVASAIEVSKIHMDMAPQIEAAESKEQQKQMNTEMQKKMMGVIQETDGITVEGYNQISKAAQKDQQLAMMIRSELENVKQAADKQ